MTPFLVMGFVFVLLIIRSILVAQRTVAARGILLRVSSTALGRVGAGQSRREQRMVTIDVEIDGQDPFEIDTVALIPLRFVDDVLPGATVAITIDPKNPRTVQVTGPGVALPAFNLAPAPMRTT